MLEKKPEKCPECGTKILEVDGKVDTPVNRLPRMRYVCPHCLYVMDVRLG